MPAFPPLPPDPPGPSFAYAGESAPPPAVELQVVSDLTAPPTPVIVQEGPYHSYAVSKVFHDGSGLALNVVQGAPGTPADVVRATAPYGEMHVRWISRRRGALPLIPSKSSPQCPNEVYLDGWVSATVPVHIGGVQVFQVEGFYRYGLRVPFTEGDAINLGAMPYTDEETSENQITPEAYSQDITGPDLPPAGAPDDEIDF